MNWVKQLFSRRRLYGDISQEIQEHLEEKIEELVANGMCRKEAVATARFCCGRREPCLSVLLHLQLRPPDMQFSHTPRGRHAAE